MFWSPLTPPPVPLCSSLWRFSVIVYSCLSGASCDLLLKAPEKVPDSLLGLHLQVPRFSNVTLLPSEQLTAQQLDGYFRLELIYKRNQRMGRRVQALLEDNPDKSFFFAFGAGGLASTHTHTHRCVFY